MEITDLHAHVLWGVDDGPETFEESCALLQSAVSQDLRALAVTPHYSRRNAVPSDRERLAERLQRLQEAFPEVKIVLGQELRYHEELPERILSGAALSLADGRYVLLEFEPEDPFERIGRGLRAVRETGKLPVLAHAERYRALDRERLRELRHSGTLIQLNYECILGSVFDREVRRCRALLKDGLADLLASDMHSLKERPFRGAEAQAVCVKLVGMERTEEVMNRIPEEILGLNTSLH